MNKKRTIRKLKETGITLVALVVTIIILLILAGVTLNLALGEGGIFARAKNTADRYQATQTNELGQLSELEKELDKYGNGGSTTGNGVGTENTTTGGDKTLGEGKKASDLKDKLVGDNSVIGKTVTGLTGGVSGSYTWKILYADANNIYLIASDYVKIEDCPQTTGGKSLNKSSSSDYLASITDIVDGTDYTSLDKIKGNETVKNLNSKFFALDLGSEVNKNVKAVSYMLDTDIWTNKIVGADNSKVEYVVGGPSIELLFDAYNAKHKTEFDEQAETIGYQIRVNSNGKWYPVLSYMLDTSDSTFVINDKKNATTYWLSSPSADYNCNVMYVGSDGSVGADGYYGEDGFRPMICLASSVILEESGGIYKIKQ